MLKDIPKYIVDDVAVAIVHDQNKNGEKEWNVYLLNFRNNVLKGVLVSSKGYGELDGESKETSVLRHFFEEVEPESVTKVEMLIESVFKLQNEYWVSFYDGEVMYDKKYIIPPDYIEASNFQDIPLLNKPGILIR
ncbi:MAG TPA: hypothetical protein PKH65_02510 [Bacteroidia bacterium]|nr:hypothetical protein [Bacteroidia bacterium]HNT79529.1 hypothetical protein [Bacteroidia bacterium]